MRIDSVPQQASASRGRFFSRPENKFAQAAGLRARKKLRAAQQKSHGFHSNRLFCPMIATQHRALARRAWFSRKPVAASKFRWFGGAEIVTVTLQVPESSASWRGPTNLIQSAEAGIGAMQKKTQDERRRSVPADNRPTLKTIAYMTGLGVTTVSRALKDAPDIGEDTKRRVQLIARQVGYRPNRAGVRLRTGKTHVISLVLNTDEQLMGFISDIIYGVSEVLSPTPYHLILTPYSSRNDAMDPVRYIVETRSADGIIISQTRPDDPRVRYMSERGFPFATHGRTQMGIEHPWHDFDNGVFARLAVERLIARGRKRLALLAPSPALTYHRHMTAGFADGIVEGGVAEIPFATAWIDQPIEEIRTQAVQLMRRQTPPDGIVSGSGAAAFALVNAIEECGLKLGAEVDVVTKQSAQLVRMFRRELLVVDEDFRLAGRELARAVLARIEGQAPETLQTLAVPTAVIGEHDAAAPAAGRPVRASLSA
jgi:LacI family transcriptional regulator